MECRSGITLILVLSGEATREDLECAERRPDHVFESVRESPRETWETWGQTTVCRFFVAFHLSLAERFVAGGVQPNRGMTMKRRDIA